MNYTDLSVGVMFMYEGNPFIVVTAEFHRMQMRKAIMRTTIRNLLTGQLLQKTFTASEQFDPAPVSEAVVRFLYREDGILHFMENETFEQYAVAEKQLGDKVKYLTDAMDVTLLLFQENPVSMVIPKKVQLKVIESPPAIKGNSVSNTFKNVTCENDIVVSVPLFIKEGDTIRISTETGDYLERVKS